MSSSPRMLLEIFKQHNDQLAALVNAGKDYAPATLDRYITTRDHIHVFLQWKYGSADIANLKKIVNGCIRKGWLPKDPFLGFRMTKHEVVKEALTEQELATLDAKMSPVDRLNFVKDIFLFSCYTGLAYADVKKLKRSEIGPGIDGNFWIFTNRKKRKQPPGYPFCRRPW